MKFVLIIFCGALLRAGTIYNITDLGSLGGTSAEAFALNANGDAAGSAATAFGDIHAFSNFGGGMTDLTINSAASEGMAAGINNNGQIAGTQFIDGQAYATEWSNGSAESIGGAGSYAMAINNTGEIAGMDAEGHAFVTINGVAFDLGTIGGDWSSAYAINDAGEVAGYGMTSSGTFRGFLWSPASGFTVLGTLGGSNSYAMAINDAGQAAGNAQAASGYTHAALWADGTVEDLGTLGGTNSYAYGINDAGQIVGYSYVDGSADPHAFVFENGVMIDLNSLIDPSSGWVLTEAYAINASGEIAGAGLFDGVEHAFLLEPAAMEQSSGMAPVPEPSTWTMFAAGLIAVLSSRFPPQLRRLQFHPRRALRRSDVSLPLLPRGEREHARRDWGIAYRR